MGLVDVCEWLKETMVLTSFYLGVTSDGMEKIFQCSEQLQGLDGTVENEQYYIL